jgi:hypothetical protein
LAAGPLAAAGEGALTAVEPFPVDHHEIITVRVLSGKTGWPVAYAHVLLLGGYDLQDLRERIYAEEEESNDVGQLHLSQQMANLPFLQVWVTKLALCQGSPRRAAFSVERMRRDGLSAPNECGLVAVEDAPGVFTVFVKTGKKPKKLKRKEVEAAEALVRPTVQAPAVVSAVVPPVVPPPPPAAAPAPLALVSPIGSGLGWPLASGAEAARIATPLPALPPVALPGVAVAKAAPRRSVRHKAAKVPSCVVTPPAAAGQVPAGANAKGAVPVAASAAKAAVLPAKGAPASKASVTHARRRRATVKAVVVKTALIAPVKSETSPAKPETNPPATKPAEPASKSGQGAAGSTPKVEQKLSPTNSTPGTAAPALEPSAKPAAATGPTPPEAAGAISAPAGLSGVKPAAGKPLGTTRHFGPPKDRMKTAQASRLEGATKAVQKPIEAETAAQKTAAPAIAPSESKPETVKNSPHQKTATPAPSEIVPKPQPQAATAPSTPTKTEPQPATTPPTKPATEPSGKPE